MQRCVRMQCSATPALRVTTHMIRQGRRDPGRRAGSKGHWGASRLHGVLEPKQRLTLALVLEAPGLPRAAPSDASFEPLCAQLRTPACAPLIANRSRVPTQHSGRLNQGTESAPRGSWAWQQETFGWYRRDRGRVGAGRLA